MKGLIQEIFDKIIKILIVIILSPLLLALTAFYFLTKGLEKKCKYHKVCPWYSRQSTTCAKEGGDYSIGMYEATPPSCYASMEEKYGSHYR